MGSSFPLTPKFAPPPAPSPLTPAQVELARRIKLLRSLLRMSAERFGEECGLLGKNRARTVYKWENGELSPSGPTMKIIGMLERRAERQEALHEKKEKAPTQDSKTLPQAGQV